MSDQGTRLAIPKLALWSEPGRYQEFPQALARAESGRCYRRTEIEWQLFDVLPTLTFPDGAPRARGTDGVVNILGLEALAGRFRLYGMNLLRRCEDGWTPSAEGLELGRLYRDEPRGDDWKRALARQIALREPRTRLLLGLMARGYELDVALNGGHPEGPLVLVAPTGLRLEVTQRSCSAFNLLLAEHSELALGPRWLSELEAAGAVKPYTWEGIQGSQPSTTDLPTHLKKALGLFFHLGAFRGDGRHWHWNNRSLLDALHIDTMDQIGFPDEEPPRLLDAHQAFVRAWEQVKDSEGFLVVSRLAHHFGELMGEEEERRATALADFIRKAEYDGHLRILERHPGQPRMGDGLFGDPGARLIKVEVLFI